MRRRTFLALMGSAAAGAWLIRPRAGAVAPAGPALAAADRETWWDPSPIGTFPYLNTVVVEWRYLAGRITTASDDFGFICSLVDRREVTNPFDPSQSIPARQELIVMRQDFKTGAHATTTYAGTLSYSGATATYTFAATGNAAVTASWRLNTAAPQSYTLSVSSPELSLSGLTLTPAGELIAEGGDGDINSGNVSGSKVRSDYYADWVTITQAGSPVGFGRLDIQTIRPTTLPTGGTLDFSHHWFVLAGTLSGGAPFWVSAWEIRSEGDTYYAATIARGTGASWAAEAFTDEAPAEASPLSVQIIDWQARPGAAGQRTGASWRLRLGKSQPADQLDVTLAVPPGQFISGIRLGSASGTMQEAVGTAASGTVLGQTIQSVRFVAAESTYKENGVPGTATPTSSPTVTGTRTTTPTSSPTATGTRTTTPTARPALYLPELDK